MEKLTILLFMIFIWLQYSFWYGKNGFKELIHLRHEISIIRENNKNIKENNNILLKELISLKENEKEYIEEKSRNELGMIKTGEIYYRLIK